MPDSISIRILEKDTNRRGDLFGRLMADLFVALGYEQPRLNIHKSGRELDLSAIHRLESRRALGECKATADTIGGDEINKFVGALDVEHEDKRPVIGYFISLSGFKETAIEQEKQRSRTKIILLTGAKVVEELVAGRIIISKDRAAELAGRCCATRKNFKFDSDAELLAHERGWIWVVYYSEGKARTAYALIHSDGTLLAQALVEEIAASDRECGGDLNQLTCLNPPPLTVTASGLEISSALAAYGHYLSNECGFIQLDGLPADSDVGSRRLRLENLFVPLHLDIMLVVEGAQVKKERQPVGAVLAEYSRLALLAAPGGGKSTLLKRLAVAYADPARRELIGDKLPKKDWVPLFFRCRELRSLARGSFAELLEALSQREPVRQHATVFRSHIDRALLEGRILLLVDGLDEISDPGDRAAFVCTVRSALQAYPGTAIVVTSREAGFRHVAAHLDPVCTRATVSSFNGDDIKQLSVAWHREVVGDTEKVRADAEQLATTITRNDRINRLANNPLLLTTLLLVKRWVGSLPTRRAVLYGKAVEVLLMTWNTEGHEPIPDEEALPQLCYVASAMMLLKVERISRRRLAILLQDARNAMPTELGYVKGKVEDFIHRVEDRSSLLMMTGHDVEDGQLVEFFEFRHLTFQEFLTARAMVEGWHQDRKDSDTLSSVLLPHCNDEKWREVVPLAAVLGGKATEALIQNLTEKIRSDIKPFASGPAPTPFIVLANSLADEAAARPETMKAAIHQLVLFGSALHQCSFKTALCQSRYGAELKEEARKAFMAATEDIANPADALLVCLASEVNEHSLIDLDMFENCSEMLANPDRLICCEGALCIGHLWGRYKNKFGELASGKNLVVKYLPRIISLLQQPYLQEQSASAYALSQLPHTFEVPSPEPYLLDRLVWLWRESDHKTLQDLGARALANLPIRSTNEVLKFPSLTAGEVSKLLNTTYKELVNPNEKTAALVIAWYTKSLSHADLTARIQTLLQSGLPDIMFTLSSLLERSRKKS